MPKFWLLAGAGVFGWLWGSFLNTVVDRTSRRAGSGPHMGWFSPPRSVCPACGVPVAAFDNVPILSYLWLRGQCRSCHAAIGVRTLVMEIATPALMVALALSLGTHANRVWALWWAAALSTGIVAVPTALERRRLARVAAAVLILAVLGAWAWLVP